MVVPNLGLRASGLELGGFRACEALGFRPR